MADAGLQVESGKIYATRRTLDGGQTYETIVRRAMVFRDRAELSAGSGRPEDEKKSLYPDSLEPSLAPILGSRCSRWDWSMECFALLNRAGGILSLANVLIGRHIRNWMFPPQSTALS